LYRNPNVTNQIKKSPDASSGDFFILALNKFTTLGVMKKRFFFFAIIGLLLSSCQHEPDHVPAAPAVVITPPADSLFFSGETLFIVADLSDEEALHDAFICVRDTADTMFSYDPYVHELTSFHVDTFWVISGSGPANLSFKVENHHELITILDLPFLRF
jgi:hypothetical protein